MFDRLELLERVASELVKTVRIDAAAGHADLEAAQVAHRGRDDDEPQRLQVPRTPCRQAWIALLQKVAAVDRFTVTVGELVKQVLRVPAAVEDVAVDVDELQRAERLRAELRGAPDDLAERRLHGGAEVRLGD